jgi:signal transduction histidine kinase
VHRYSGSRTARIQVTRDNGRVRVEIKDEGCGLSRPTHPDLMETVGVGIAGMRERIHELNGIFEIESAPGRGTIVRAVLPDSYPQRAPRVRGAVLSMGAEGFAQRSE